MFIFSRSSSLSFQSIEKSSQSCRRAFFTAVLSSYPYSPNYLSIHVSVYLPIYHDGVWEKVIGRQRFSLGIFWANPLTVRPPCANLRGGCVGGFVGIWWLILEKWAEMGKNRHKSGCFRPLALELQILVPFGSSHAMSFRSIPFNSVRYRWVPTKTRRNGPKKG